MWSGTTSLRTRWKLTGHPSSNLCMSMKLSSTGQYRTSAGLWWVASSVRRRMGFAFRVVRQVVMELIVRDQPHPRIKYTRVRCCQFCMLPGLTPCWPRSSGITFRPKSSIVEENHPYSYKSHGEFFSYLALSSPLIAWWLYADANTDAKTLAASGQVII